MSSSPHDDHDHAPDCATAHGEAPPDAAALPAGTLVAVYASPVAEVLLRWGRELGYATALLDPDPGRLTDAHRAVAEAITHAGRWGHFRSSRWGHF